MRKNNLIFFCAVLLWCLLFANTAWSQTAHDHQITSDEPTTSNHIINHNGLILSYESPMYERGELVMSRLSTKDSLVFYLLHEVDLPGDTIYISISEDGLKYNDFENTVAIGGLDNNNWYRVAVYCPPSKSGNRFVAWSFKPIKSIEDKQKSIGSHLNDLFLHHIIRPYNQFDKLTEGGYQEMMLTLNNQQVTLLLEEVELRGDNYKVRLFNGEQIKDYTEQDKAKTYKGIRKDGKGRVRLTVNDNFVYGLIEDEDETFYLEPARFYDMESPASAIIQYSNKETTPVHEKICGTEADGKNGRSFGFVPGKTSENCAIVDYNIASDYSMLQKYGTVNDLINRNLGVLNNMQVNYIGWFNKNYVFKIGEQFLVTCSGCDPWTSSTDAETLLISFRLWAGSGFSAVHDVASLWTNRDFDGSTIGIAYVGAVCSGGFRYNVNQDFNSNAEFIRVLIAHELGHNFGSGHDGSGESFIMAPAVSSSTTWSGQSQTAINNYMNGVSCVTDCPNDAPAQCGGYFYDTGGPDEPYNNNESYTTTICPDNPSLESVSVWFHNFKTELGTDILSCYDGDNTNGTLLWSHSGPNLPASNPTIATHSSGCLTFQFQSNGANVDLGWSAEVTCIENGPCPAPNNLNLISASESSAILGWTEVGEAINWDIEYGTAGFSPTGIPTISTADNPYTISGLNPNTSYEAFIRSNCDIDGFSSWSGPLVFTTPAPVPSNNTCSNAIPITPAASCAYIQGSTVQATNSMPAVSCNGFTASNPLDVWYTFESLGLHDYVITMDMTVDGIVVLYKESCDNLVYVNCADNNFGSGIEEINAGYLEEGTYFIRIYGWESQGNFNLCVVQTDAFSVANGLFEDCNNFPAIETGQDPNWINITDGNGGVISSVYFPQANASVNFDPIIFLTTSIREDGAGQKYVGRDINIESSENGFPEDLLLRLYYTEAEINALIAADDNVSSISDINITKTTGNCTGGFSGEGTFYPQVASGTYSNGYYIDIEVNSFSTFFAHGGIQPLPVSLISFRGAIVKNKNVLSWTTEHEYLLSHYIIEKSDDGHRFRPIGKVYPNGLNGEDLNEYIFTDDQPGLKTYYRLISVDQDHSQETSKTIVLNRPNIEKIKVYPNPAGRVLYCSGLIDQEGQFQITDLNGKTVHFGQLQPNVEIDISQLKSGIYLINIASASQREVVRFVKIN